MTSKFIRAVDKGALVLPNDIKWVKSNLHYEVIGGSHSYGLTQDDSDVDIIGWCIPPKSYVFPYHHGYIHGFGPSPQSFNVYQRHHVEHSNTEYDFTIYSVVKFVDLVMSNNPNMIDYIFTPFEWITHMTEIGQILRNNRKGFLHKGAYHKFKGYAYSQVKKMRDKQVWDGMSPKRRASIEKYGMDVKFAYHIVRLLDECHQILETGDLDIQRDRERLKAIRRGEWSQERIVEFVSSQEPILEDLYAKSTLPHSPDLTWCRNILLQILEAHYGSLTEVEKTDSGDVLLNELRALVQKYS